MAEKTIMLNCAAGMSTSVLVNKMQQAAEKDGLDYEIFACSASEAEEKLATKDIDVVLLGPQVSYMRADFETKLAGKAKDGSDIPFDVIDMRSYGMMDGEAVLQQARSLMK
ncbi:PTS system, cellobiose-specific IIB component [Ligilactobacillus hayakitensis DSM 18933 = JCM 14209]|uniref:PTS system, cellobiose-specific IIB component n=1 Tax=Ligilactobacillus hayakitensis DSM 18933 = JCM 14209 TaxID=1423755 RepID=A0A0R1WMS1_9LACO|nr:PTS sugar transporter subunit IIB [Ligilactobacillus hayakitensis]KRM19159.1 PTS system, cellobiose-specific IIB component [Ligilactobacillus hayakitensis DSM 18933 = JCM 14209]